MAVTYRDGVYIGETTPEETMREAQASQAESAANAAEAFSNAQNAFQARAQAARPVVNQNGFYSYGAVSPDEMESLRQELFAPLQQYTARFTERGATPQIRSISGGGLARVDPFTGHVNVIREGKQTLSPLVQSKQKEYEAQIGRLQSQLQNIDRVFEPERYKEVEDQISKYQIMRDELLSASESKTQSVPSPFSEPFGNVPQAERTPSGFIGGKGQPNRMEWGTDNLFQSPQQPITARVTSGRLPAPGEIRNGYRYNGGNPADRNAWDKVR